MEPQGLNNDLHTALALVVIMAQETIGLTLARCHSGCPECPASLQLPVQKGSCFPCASLSRLPAPRGGLEFPSVMVALSLRSPLSKVRDITHPEVSLYSRS